jgi:hypothetical protein
MNEKETAKKLALLDHELGALADEVDQTKLNLRSDLDTLRLEIEALKAYLKDLHPEFGQRFVKIKANTVLDTNPEWIPGPS